MVLVNWIIISTVVATEERPAAQVTVVFVTRVKHVAVKVQSITSKRKSIQN